MRSISVQCALVFLSMATPALSETPMQKMMCDQVMSPLLELSQAMSGATDSFDNSYNSEMDAETKTIFAEVSKENAALRETIEAYRNAFIKACFGQ